MRRFILFFVTLFAGVALSPVSADNDNQYSIIGASFTYHVYPPGKHEEYFSNRLIAVARYTDILPYVDRLMLGTLKNSSGNRCLMIGVGRDWKKLNEKAKVIGIYSYVGEFFADTFDECSDEGIYKDMDSVVGIGFAPYIYHGVNYNLIQQLSINGGLIFPGVVSFALEYSF